MFDQETWLFINSFAPWLAALGTLLAVIVSLHLARRTSQPDIRVFTDRVSMFSELRPRKSFIRINAVNHSRKVDVNTIAWWSQWPLGFGRRKQRWIVLPLDDPLSMKLPCELDFGKEADFFFPLATFHEHWKSLLEHVGDSKFQGLTFRLLRVGVVTSTDQYFGAPLNQKMREIILECIATEEARSALKISKTEAD